MLPLASLLLVAQALVKRPCRALEPLSGNPEPLANNRPLGRLQLLVIHQLSGRLQLLVVLRPLDKLLRQLKGQHLARRTLWGRRSRQMLSVNQPLDRARSDKQRTLVQARRRSASSQRPLTPPLLSNLRKALSNLHSVRQHSQGNSQTRLVKHKLNNPRVKQILLEVQLLQHHQLQRSASRAHLPLVQLALVGIKLSLPIHKPKVLSPNNQHNQPRPWRQLLHLLAPKIRLPQP